MTDKRYGKSKTTHQGDELIQWYLENRRDLPWRKTKDPYKIWISETMLQQTTTAAVIPYYERFLKRFPTVQKLAKASIEDVYERWSGLGYYSRARNLHKASQILQKNFPQSADKLIQLPGFGPYTSRAVASLAFGERVGVLDGNVIRVLTRWMAHSGEWWKTSVRNELQQKSDEFAIKHDPSLSNQALMELGATICLPKSPKCLLCPVSSHCNAFQMGRALDFPLIKPKRNREIWQWTPDVQTYKGKVRFIKNDYAPFLKGQLLLPGKAKKLSKPPKKFDFKHTITHHDIFVQTRKESLNSSEVKRLDSPIWISQQDLSRKVPVSLVKKVISHTDL